MRGEQQRVAIRQKGGGDIAGARRGALLGAQGAVVDRDGLVREDQQPPALRGERDGRFTQRDAAELFAVLPETREHGAAAGDVLPQGDDRELRGELIVLERVAAEAESRKRLARAAVKIKIFLRQHAEIAVFGVVQAQTELAVELDGRGLLFAVERKEMHLAPALLWLNSSMLSRSDPSISFVQLRDAHRQLLLEILQPQ